MKITEILVESHELEEGPLLNKIGSGIGKFAGTVAKGVGAVAGGVAGAGTAMKKGWDAGKAAVGAAGDDVPDAAGGPEAHPSTSDINKSGPANTAQAKPLQGQAKVAADKTAAATAGQDPAAAGQTMYAQVKANIDKLDKKGKQRILQLLQKSVAAPAATAPASGSDAMGAMAGQLGGAKPAGAPANTMANAPVSKTNTAKPGNPNAAPTATKTAPPKAGASAPAAQPDELGRVEPTMEPAAEPNYNTQTGVASPAQMKKNREAGQAAAPNGFDTKTGKPNPAPAAAPAKSKPVARVGTTPAAAGPNFDTQTGKMLPGRAINAVKKRAEVGAGALGKARKGMQARADQATIDADRNKIMGTTTDSVVRTQPSLAEGFSLYRKRA